MIGSACFGHYYAYHQELTKVAVGWKSGEGSLPAPDFQPTATQEWDDQCGNQHYSRELLMMGIRVPETC